MIHHIFPFEGGVECAIAPTWRYFKGNLIFGVGFEARWVHELEKNEKSRKSRRRRGGEEEEEKQISKISGFQLGGVNWIPVPVFDT